VCSFRSVSPALVVEAYLPGLEFLCLPAGVIQAPLKATLEDEDEPGVLLIALRHLDQAQGMEKVAKAAGIERESLYRALSEHGNPRLSTPVAVTKAIGLRLTVEADQ